MVDANEIKAAIELMDAKDDAQWEADGSPKLDILKTLTNKPELTLDDVDEAVGAFKRGQKVKVAKHADETKPVEPIAPAVDLSKLDPNGPEYATEVVRVARAEDARLKVLVAEAEAVRNAAANEVKKLTAARDEQVIIIERYAPQITHAQAVKAIQAQTVKNLADTKGRVALATQALAATGQQLVYPSKLDATLAMRKRTPEQATNFAKFVHQQAQARTPAG